MATPNLCNNYNALQSTKMTYIVAVTSNKYPPCNCSNQAQLSKLDERTLYYSSY